jgi:hypothetical protein
MNSAIYGFIGFNAKLICIEHIVFGNYVTFGSQIWNYGYNFHQMVDTVDTGEDITMPILIGMLLGFPLAKH